MKLKALIRKDLHVLGSQGWLLVAIDAVFAAIPVLSHFGILFATILPYTLLADDQRTRWSRMAAMMPYTTRDLVLSRYVLGWGYAIVASVIVAAVNTAERLLLPNFQIPPVPVLPVLCLAAGLLAVVMPLVIRFGPSKGRLINALIIGSICASANIMNNITLPVMSLPRLLWLVPAAVAAGLTAVSIPLSLRWYEQQER